MNKILFIDLEPDELRALIKDSIFEALEKQPISSLPQQSDSDELLRLNQVAELLQVSKVTIHNWKRTGKLPFHRISNKIFFKKSEVISSLKESKRYNNV